MNDSDTGKTISQCFSYAGQVARELDALAGTLTEQLETSLETVLENRGVALMRSTESVVTGDETDESGWIYVGYSWNTPLKRSGKGNRATECWLGFQIGVIGNTIPLAGADEPVLYVFLTDGPFDWKTQYLGFPLDHYDDLRVCEDRLVVWGQCDSGNPIAASWCFALRIAELPNADALKKQAVDPAMVLLQDCTAVLDALPDALPALVKLPHVEVLTGKAA